MFRLHGFFTQNSRKPLYVLSELGVEFEFVFINLAAGEQRSGDFLQKNPLGKVPVLEHDGRCFTESGAICRYVANVTESPLYPPEPRRRRRRRAVPRPPRAEEEGEEDGARVSHSR